MSTPILGKTAAEISECIRTLVERGDLKPGQTLPAVRELAVQLSVNRNTIASAYQRLAKAGIASTNGRHGTAIKPVPKVAEQEGSTIGTPLVDLANGNPDPGFLAKLPELIAQCAPASVLYGEQTVTPVLRRFADTWLASDCPSPWELELTNGALDAIERLLAAYLSPNDKVAVEDPCYLGSSNALHVMGLQAIGVTVDEAGMQPGALANALARGARTVILTPRAHNPTGCSLSKQRAQELKQILTAYPHVMVILDDHFALPAETPWHAVVPSTSTRWALIRSVSKALGPDLRLAFVACDATTAARLRTRLAPGMMWVSHILQSIVATALISPDLPRQISEAREAYAMRRSTLISALRSHDILVPKPSDGVNIWIPLPVAAKDVAYALAKKGWLVRLGNAFCVQNHTEAIRVTVSTLEESSALSFANDLAAAIAELKLRR
jgi:DNA-binding transcriptional MocR family regulator